MPAVGRLKTLDYAAPRATRVSLAATGLLAGLGWLVAAKPAAAEGLTFAAWASATETYTTNINYSPGSEAEGGFVTSVAAGMNISGETGGKRLKLRGSLGLSQQVYIGQSQNNAIAPTANTSTPGAGSSPSTSSGAM